MTEPAAHEVRPGGELEDIPVEELIRRAREFTRRVTNQDRQRLGVELRESGHQRSLALRAPLLLQQFFSGEIDLDAELAQRFANAPLLSSVKTSGEGGQAQGRQVTALLSSNDESTVVTIDAHLDASAGLEVAFTLFSAIGLRFHLGTLPAADRRRWLDLMRRPSGITFLWTRERWEEPYLVFVVRERYGRVYAFSPAGTEAAARLTPDAISGTVDWLEDLWFPGERAARLADQDEAGADRRTIAAGDWAEEPSHLRRPERARLPRGLAADRPEEQWETAPPAPEEAAPEDAALEDDSFADEVQW